MPLSAATLPTSRLSCGSPGKSALRRKRLMYWISAVKPTDLTMPRQASPKRTKPPAPDAAVPMDATQWSEESKRSYFCCGHTYSASDRYNDIHYTCRRCASPAVFTAADQKRSFEVKKNYIWQSRHLCPACHAQWVQLKAKDRACQARWTEDRRTLMQDEGFMRDWLEVLEALPTYDGRKQSSMKTCLRKLLNQRSEPKQRPAPAPTPIDARHPQSPAEGSP